MRKVFIGFVVFVFLLAGCSGNSDTAGDTSTDTTAATSGLWIKESPVEQETKGAVRQYALAEKDYDGIFGIGDQVVLIRTGEKIQVQILSGTEGVLIGEISLDAEKTLSLQVTYSGVVYYDVENNQAVILNSQLKEASRYTLPEGIEGAPVFTTDGNTAYYCVGKEIRAYDMEQGISRLIKSHNCKEQTLLNTYFEGDLLCCKVVDEAGKEQTFWVSTQTGETLHTDDAIKNLWTFEDNFFATRADGTVEQRIFGKMDGELQEMKTDDTNMVSALPLGSLLGYRLDEGRLQVSLYDTQSGQKTASVSFETDGQPKNFLADRWSQCVWILVSNPDAEDFLLRWDVRTSKIEEEGTYISALYTKEAPDEEGLAACQKRVDALNRKHGLYIRIWEHAAKYPRGVAMEAEYQVSAINSFLDELEKVLDMFPKDYLYKSVKDRIRVCIVRSLEGEVAANHYWFDGDGFVVLSVGVDVEEEFIKGIGYIVDSHVLGNSPQYDYWDNTNPENFIYGNSATYKTEYLSEENRTFVDTESMESATTDRSRIFWKAMTKGNEELFKSETMQKKLKEICLGIRDAWRWERKTEVFPWEQYLKESIAYEEKK